MQNPIYIIGCSNESMNAAVVMASLDNQVTLIYNDDEISTTLDHYRFERQFVSLWDLYTKEHKIHTQKNVLASVSEIFAKDAHTSHTFWLFLDTLTAEALAQIAKLISSPHATVILSGTTPPQQAHDFANQLATPWVFYLPFIFMQDGANFTSILKPNLVLIGEKTHASYSQSDILLFFTSNSERQYISDIKTVEFARSSIMAMLATRISFMNEMARLADAQHIDIQQIQAMMGLDSRIGQDFLAAGWGFGGMSLPKELAFLTQQFEQNQVNSALIHAVVAINEDQKELIFRKFWQHFDGFIENKTVVIWGAGYRNGTGRTTNSAIHPLLKLLWSYNIKTLVFATNTAFELQNLYKQQPLFELITHAYEPLQTADALFIINWSAPRQPNITKLNQVAIPIFDGKNVLSDSLVEKLIGNYYGIGR